MLTASWDGSARLWDASTGAPAGLPFKHSLMLNSAHFSPDGRSVVTASRDATARIWNLECQERPEEYVVRLAQVLSGQRINSDGSLRPVAVEKLLADQEALRSKSSVHFAASPSAIPRLAPDRLERLRQGETVVHGPRPRPRPGAPGAG